MDKVWKIGILKDTSKSMLGLHGLHVAFRGLPNIEIVAHVDSNTENLEEKMAWTQAKRHYTSFTEMLDIEKPDIAVITSRCPFDHIQPILEAAKRGVHVYCEKPLTVDLLDADRIIAAVELSGVKVCMAHPARYALAFRTMREMIEAGEIGTPLTVHGRGKCDHRGGGEDLIVLGTHILDFMIYLFGNPESVWAEVRQDGKPIRKETRRDIVEDLGPVAGDDIFAVLRFPAEVRGIFESRKNLFMPESKNIYMGLTVNGTKGALSLRFNDMFEPVYKLRISREPAPVEDKCQYTEIPLKETRHIGGSDPLDYSLCGSRDIPREPFFLEANRFAVWDLISSIRENRLPVSNIYNARQTIEMIFGIYESHLNETKVHFPLCNRNNPLTL